MANLMAIYNEAVQHSHAAGLSAVALVVAAETRNEVNSIRDEMEKSLVGIDIRAILAENETLKAQVTDLAAQVVGLTDKLTLLPTVRGTEVVKASEPTPTNEEAPAEAPAEAPVANIADTAP